MRCEEVNITLGSVIGIDLALSRFSWNYDLISATPDYASSVNTFDKMLKEVIRLNEDKPYLFINSTITELLIEEITL